MTADATAQSEGAILQVIAAIADTWNRHDMKAFARLYSEDADYVNIGGQHLKGREEIETHHIRLHSGHYADSHLSTTPRGTRFVRSDIAITHLGCDVVYQNGTEKRSTVMTLVLTKDGAGWLITAAQNTLIVGSPVVSAASPPDRRQEDSRLKMRWAVSALIGSSGMKYLNPTA